MLIPWNTDAPIYYWPFATVGLIAVNTAVFFGFVAAPPEAMEPWILEYGDGLHPVQWLTSNFLHSGFFHLLGNMVCLWGFGLVVEGKLGWFKFLAVYLGLGVAECALEQTLALGLEGGSLGASAIIYGLIGMSLVWAPENELSCLLLVTLRPHLFEMRIVAFAFIYLLLEVFFVWFYGMTMSSAVIHLLGAVLGFVLGTVMLKANWVDCENWDLFAVIAGRGGEARKKKKKKVEQVDPETAARRKTAKLTQSILQIKKQLADGQTADALAAYRQMVSPPYSYEVSEPDLLELITTLHSQKAFGDSQPLMVDYLRRFPDKATRMRLKLAEILVHDRRPRQALRVLSKLAGKALPEKLEGFRQRLEQQATSILDEAEIELQCEDW